MKNLYPGINPHLNSRLQSPRGDWQSFHNSCIERMADLLEEVLPPGYYPFTEKSLQLQRLEPPGPEYRNRPDILVNRESSARDAANFQAIEGSVPTLVLPVIETLVEEDVLMSIVIYQAGDDVPGEPVTRIELLSPGNKPGGGHHEQYIINRSLTLESGLNLVEIDWLHETRPLLATLPVYSKAPLYPYSILVSDPHPSLRQGQTAIYGFRVQDKIPVIRMPLKNETSVLVDFGQIYNRTLEGRNAFGLLIHYDQLPVRFETYDELDRNYILQRMTEIANQVE